jgi:hypothetical protein
MNEHDRAVVIGIRRYVDVNDPHRWITNLDGPDNDAAAIAKWLRDPNGGGLPEKHVDVVRSADFPDPFRSRRRAGPQRFAIEKALNKVAKLRRRAYERQYTGRRLYIYVSGHGYAKTRNEAALLTAEAEWDFQHNVLITSWVEWFWKAARFKELVLWADCCATREPVVVFMPCGRNLESSDNAKYCRVFKAYAAKFDQYAVEREMPENGKCYSVFTWALLQGLNGAAARSGAITSQSLREYLTTNMALFLRDDQRRNPMVAKEPDFGEVDLITFRVIDQSRTRRYPVTLRFPAACVGEHVMVVTTRSNPPAATTILERPDWELCLEAGAYAAYVRTRDLVHAFTVTGERIDGVITIF